MLRIEVQVQGKSPLLCNRFIPSFDSENKTPQEIAEKKLYLSRSKPHKPIIPGPNLYQSIIQGCWSYFLSIKQGTRNQLNLIPGFIIVEEDEIHIQHVEPWVVDERSVRIPPTGERALTYRPRFNDWVLNFHLLLDEETVKPEQMRKMVEVAGKRIGLGDFRPRCGGPFGKFEVTTWNVLGNGDGKQGKKK